VTQPSRAKVIDVHTHMYSHGWVQAVEGAADPTFRIGENGALIYRGGSIGRKTPPMLDWQVAAAQHEYDGRIRWFASLPLQHEHDALAELRRAKGNGAIGVCTLTNILGTPLTAPQ
jgi:hypothetical protein